MIEDVKKMYRIPLAETLVPLLRTFKQWGGLIDYIQIGEEKSILSEAPSEQHRAAAVFTAQAVTDAHIRYRQECFHEQEAEVKTVWPWLTEYTLFRIDQRKGTDIRPAEMDGQQIIPREFFAPPILWVGRDEVDKLPSWWDANAFVAGLERNNEDGCFIATGSYPYAFRKTPYGLSYNAPSSLSYRKQVEEQELRVEVPSKLEIDDLFQAINRQLFGETFEALTVYRWSTNGIDFFQFDPHVGWWGSYLWTVFNAKTQTFVGIAASATDVNLHFYRYFDERKRPLSL